MARELWLMRHAKSAWPEGVADYNRPLKKRGRKTAQAMGEWLGQHGQVPDWIVSSPADRARETAEKLCKGLQLNRHKYLIFDDRLYQASVSELKAVLADCPSFKQRVLLIGHNPEFDTLLLDLSQTSLQLDSEGKILGTAHLAMLSLPDDWQTLPSACATLLDIIRPKTVLNLEAIDADIAPTGTAIPPSIGNVLTEPVTPAVPIYTALDQQTIQPSADSNRLGRVRHWLQTVLSRRTRD